VGHLKINKEGNITALADLYPAISLPTVTDNSTGRRRLMNTAEGGTQYKYYDYVQDIKYAEIKKACGFVEDGQSTFSVAATTISTSHVKVTVLGTTPNACETVSSGGDLANLKATITVGDKPYLVSCPEKGDVCQLLYGPVEVGSAGGNSPGGNNGRRRLQQAWDALAFTASQTANGASLVNACKDVNSQDPEVSRRAEQTCHNKLNDMQCQVAGLAVSAIVTIATDGAGMYATPILSAAATKACSVALGIASGDTGYVIEQAHDMTSAVVAGMCATGNCGGGGGDDGGCFPNNALVSTPTGTKRMYELRIGDSVLAARHDGSSFFDEIYLFGHRDSTIMSQFVKIDTASGHSLSLTPDHQLLISSDQAGALKETPAAAVKVGDFVRIVNSQGSFLTAITAASLVKDQGLWNPYTLSGTIIVNDVAASCHSSWALDGLFSMMGVSAATGYQAAFAPIRFVYRIAGAKAMAAVHVAFDPIIEAGINHGPMGLVAFVAAPMAVYMAVSAKRV